MELLGSGRAMSEHVGLRLCNINDRGLRHHWSDLLLTTQKKFHPDAIYCSYMRAVIFIGLSCHLAVGKINCKMYKDSWRILSAIKISRGLLRNWVNLTCIALMLKNEKLGAVIIFQT